MHFSVKVLFQSYWGAANVHFTSCKGERKQGHNSITHTKVKGVNQKVPFLDTFSLKSRRGYAHIESTSSLAQGVC